MAMRWQIMPPIDTPIMSARGSSRWSIKSTASCARSSMVHGSGGTLLRPAPRLSKLTTVRCLAGARQPGDGHGSALLAEVALELLLGQRGDARIRALGEVGELGLGVGRLHVVEEVHPASAGLVAEVSVGNK